MKRTLTFFLLFYSSLSQAQVIATVNDEPIHADEFLWVYRKNHPTGVNNDYKSIAEYLQLYIDFKLKVQEAKAEHYDRNEGYISDIAGFRKTLIGKYLLDREVTDKLVKEAYERSKLLVNAGQILVFCAPDASPEDSLKAYNKIQEAKTALDAGTAFEDVASKYSEDPDVKENKGYMGGFSVFQMVYPFENAAYNTPVGHISSIIRTKFGYHLIKVNSVKPNIGQRAVAHILVSFNHAVSAADSLQVKQRINEIYKKVLAGEDFATLANKYSDDRTSAVDGGALPPFSEGQVVKAFSDAAYALKKPGALSEPVQTKFGWHIIKLINEVPFPTFDAVKNELKNKVAFDDRSQVSKNRFLNRLMTAYKFTEYPEAAAIIKTLNYDELKKENFNDGRKLFSIANKNYTVNDLAAAIGDEHENTSQLAYEYSIFKEKQLIAKEEDLIPIKYPEFNYLYDEYCEGALMFQISEKKVWDKGQLDDIGLYKYYEDHLDHYHGKVLEEIKGNVIADYQQALDKEWVKGLRSKATVKINTSVLKKVSSTKRATLVINKNKS